MRMFATLLLPLALALAAPAVRAHEYRAGDLEITHPWARATGAAQKNGAAYMTVRNHGAEPDRLLSVRTGEAQGAEVHGTTVNAEGVARMRPVDGLAIPAGGEAELAPSGLHIMLIGLKGRLYEGVSFPMTLVFERVGAVDVEVEVIGDDAPVDHHGSEPVSGPGMEHGHHGAGHGP